MLWSAKHLGEGTKFPFLNNIKQKDEAESGIFSGILNQKKHSKIICSDARMWAIKP